MIFSSVDGIIGLHSFGLNSHHIMPIVLLLFFLVVKPLITLVHAFEKTGAVFLIPLS